MGSGGIPALRDTVSGLLEKIPGLKIFTERRRYMERNKSTDKSYDT